MAHAGSDEILAAALTQLAKERGSAPDESLIAHSIYDTSSTYIPYRDTEEPHNTNPVLFTDEYGRDIKGSMSTEDANRPGLHDPADVEAGRVLNDDNVIPYPTDNPVEDEVSNALPFLEDFMAEKQLANLSDYRRRWINHTSGKDVITDPIYRKNLQDIILYPDRFGFGNLRV